MRALPLLILCVFLHTLGFSQAKTNITDVRNVYDEKGDYYYDKKDFKKAIVYYNMAFKLNSNNYYSVLRKAEAYTSMGLYDQAAECYGVIFATDLHISNEYRMQYALLLLKNKNITGFEKEMAAYNEIVRSEIHDYLTSKEVRAKMYKDTSFVVVENENVLNTAESEISPAIYHDKILFASNRKNLAGEGSNRYYNLLSANYLDDGHLGRLNTYNTSLNTTLSESSVTFSDKTNSMYFTRSASTNAKLKSFVGNIPSSMNSKPDIREFSIGGYNNIGQIALNSTSTVMYFVSDVPGGSGGLDLYSSELVGGKWSSPKNLGTAINSAKDEMYPCILHDSLLYFSSAGHNGLGGLDLFVVNLKSENSAPKNLGEQVNSASDDYALTFSPTGLTGYFCSNRPGGFGKEDIYRLHLLDIKVKLPAYRFKKKPSMETDKINLYLSSGDEYNIASKDKMGFVFGFLPGEAYKMVIQHEDPLASDIIYNTKLTEDQRKKELLSPPPLQKTDIRLQTGMKYEFTAGMQPIGADYKKALNEMTKSYQNTGSNTIDLTALAKELLLEEGEIYTIRFVKDDNLIQDSKSKAGSSLFINDQTIPVTGESFFIVLPLDVQANFNIQTDLAHFKESFSPKKVGTVKVDAGPVYKEKPVVQSEGFPILVNTESENDVSQKKITATELTIIPGSMYILTFRKTNAPAGEPGVVIPLTKGVKYNLGSEAVSENEYNKTLSQMTAGQAGSNTNEELIDISVLSKELDIASEKDIIFSLTPARQFASQVTGGANVLTTLSVDGRKYFVTSRVKMLVNLKLEQNKKVNIQTDLAYVKENFDPSTIAIKVDTTSFNRNLAEKKKPVITDPVFDVIIVNFNLNDYSLRPEAKSLIAEKVIEVLKNDSRIYVTIKGYTDPLGDAAYNEKLSRNRAQTVKDFLINNGIGENRIRTFSYGESLALQEGVKWEELSEAELQKYRKVEIVMYLPK
jgi:outer membrane protein OmpA-like peptidoglycan-associated protein/tetratricopeptide (TPR) repeat protein